MRKVVLRRLAIHRFPERCVICGRPEPMAGATVGARDSRKGRAWWAGWFFVRVPCCRFCWIRLHISRLTRGLAPPAVIVVASLAYISFSSSVASWVATLLSVVLGAIGLVLLGLINERFPPPFSIDPRDSSVVYLFRDPSLGEEFEALNRTPS